MTRFPQALQALSSAGVEFVLIGGLAAAAHGSSRVTLDIDIVYRRTPENISRLVQAIAPHELCPRGAPPGLPFTFDEAKDLEAIAELELLRDE